LTWPTTNKKTKIWRTRQQSLFQNQ